LLSDEIKTVILALLAGRAWRSNNQPIPRRGIFSDVGKGWGVTQQLPLHEWNIALAIARVYLKKGLLHNFVISDM
jgi:hypothetical protein